METVRGILAAHPGGISRAGILAWAQLRIDPDFDGTRLDAELAALGSEIVERDGFLWLASAEGAPAPEPSLPRPAPTSRAGAAPHADAGSAGEPPPWRPDEVSAPPTGWPSLEVTEWTAPPRRGLASGIGCGAKFLGLAIFAAVLVANLAGVLVGFMTEERPEPTGPRPTVAGSPGPVGDLTVGDCIAVPDESEFGEVVYVPCTQPHEAEVFLVSDHPGGPEGYPGSAGFGSWTDSVCLPAFAVYTGSAYDDQSLLEMGWFMPTEGGWDAGDRTVQCYLTRADGWPATVSYRGAEP